MAHVVNRRIGYDFTNLHRVRASGKEAWWSAFIISKGIGFGTAYLIYRLVTYWSKKGLIQDFNEDEEV